MLVLLKAFCLSSFTKTLGKLCEKEIEIVKIEKENRQEKMNPITKKWF